MKTTYSTVTLRYVHDVVTGEFANVGQVLYAPTERFLQARFTTSYERLNAMFLKIDHNHFRSTMGFLSKRFEQLSDDVKQGLDFQASERLPELVRQVLPEDDSSLQWSPLSGGLTEDPGRTLQELFTRFVERYFPGGEVLSRDDEEIAKPFRTKLGRAAQKLTRKKLSTPDYQYEFQFAWKNDVWHFYEPVSFDLVDPNSIREKANRWLGRGVALHDAQENFKLHFLLGEPKDPANREAFENALHLLNKIPGNRELIREQEIEPFATRVAEEMENHQSSEMMLRDKPRD